MIFLVLFGEFFKIGLFSIGGGLATLPFLYEIADKYPWLTMADLTNMIAVSESTPGPIGINMATFAGFQAAGIAGALVSTFALVLPSFIIILAVAGFLTKFSENFYVKSAFYGLRPAVVGMIAASGFGIVCEALFHTNSVFTLFTQGRFDILSVIIFGIFIILMNIKQLKKLHPVVYILTGAVLGIAFSM